MYTLKENEIEILNKEQQTKKKKDNRLSPDSRRSPVEQSELLKSCQYDEDFFNKQNDLLKEISYNEMRLLKDPEKFKNDPSLILYRLPITDNMREKIYNDLIKSSNS